MTISICKQSQATDLIDSPCPYMSQAPSFDGNEATADCGMCKTRVHNLSAVTEEEAEAMLASDEVSCITYLADKRGEPVYKKSRRPFSLVRAAGVAALAMGAVLQVGCGEWTRAITGGDASAKSTKGGKTAGPRRDGRLRVKGGKRAQTKRFKHPKGGETLARPSGK